MQKRMQLLTGVTEIVSIWLASFHQQDHESTLVVQAGSRDNNGRTDVCDVKDGASAVADWALLR